jgi:hypothetical protein
VLGCKRDAPGVHNDACDDDRIPVYSTSFSGGSGAPWTPLSRPAAFFIAVNGKRRLSKAR